MCFHHRHVLMKKFEDVFTMLIDVVQPVLGSFCIVSPRPTPAVFKFEFTGDTQKKFIRGHGASAKEVLGHPIVFSFHLKGVGGGTVAKDMGE